MMNHPFDIFYRHFLHAPAWLAVWALLTVGAVNTACADPVYDLARKYFPQADRVGEFEGEPIAAPVHEDERVDIDQGSQY